MEVTRKQDPRVTEPSPLAISVFQYFLLIWNKSFCHLLSRMIHNPVTKKYATTIVTETFSLNCQAKFTPQMELLSQTHLDEINNTKKY